MFDGHVYSVTMQNQTIVADASVVCIRTATAQSSRASVIKILRVWVGQIREEASQQLGVIVGLKASAFGTFTSTTPTPHLVNGTASGITGSTSVAAASAGTDASAEGGGAVTPIIYDGFNNLNGWLWVPTPEERLVVNLDTAIVLKIVGTPTTLTGWSAGITYAEVN
jgi:hypothetical protein